MVARDIVRDIVRNTSGEVGNPGGGGLTYAQVVADALAYWPLQDDAANTTVVNDNGTNGVLVGGNTTADLSGAGPGGILAKALVLDGTADYVDTNVRVTLASSVLTIAGRINASAVNDMIIAQGGLSLGGWFLRTDASGRLELFLKKNGSSATHYSIRGGTDIRSAFHSIIAEIDYSGDDPVVQFWVDGNAETMTPGTPKADTYGDDAIDMLIGSRGATDNLAGSVAGFAVWNRALTSTERDLIVGIV